MKIIFLITSLLVAVAFANAQEVCRYTNSKGEARISPKSEVPIKFRRTAECLDLKSQNILVAPDKIELGGTTRREDMNTALGRVQLRWPRNIEVLFGRTPNRAVQEAARAVARVLRQASFPAQLQNTNIPWSIVFLDVREQSTQSQIPSYLIQNCHPGWMTPPANIYIVAQRVAGDCSTTKSSSNTGKVSGVADAKLAEVLVHEFGHVVEFQLLKNSQSQSRLQAEGFATWFEHLAANESPLLNARSLNNRRLEEARRSFRINPTFNFSKGDSLDYSRASYYFSAIQNRFGTRGVIELYDTMGSERLDLFTAAEKKLKWNKEQFEREVAKLVE